MTIVDRVDPMMNPNNLMLSFSHATARREKVDGNRGGDRVRERGS